MKFAAVFRSNEIEMKRGRHLEKGDPVCLRAVIEGFER